MANPVKQQVSARDALATCLLEMAAAETNPVLQVINLDQPLQENKKYPADLLRFNQSGWRAYYHCHPANRAGNHRFKGEHGHFHLFVQTNSKPKKWSHVAAIAMDSMGQPLGWFTVNHWVTGEVWERADTLIRLLKSIPYTQPVSLVERWLLSILALSHNKLKALLLERDEILKQHELKNDDAKQDREIYLLSEIPVNLMSLLNVGQNKN